MAKTSPEPLAGVDLVLADLDGVVYRGPHAIAHAVESLNAASALTPVAYMTNNASRPDSAVAEHLNSLGLDVRSRDVITSPQAALRVLRTLVGPPATVFVVGGEGILTELDRAGYTATRSADDAPAAVIQGFAHDIGWPQLAEASYVLADPAVPWVATNSDWTIPTERGIAPGNGTLVSAVHSAVGRLPLIAGKPEATIFEEATERFGARAPLFIGDRLDTDIKGAVRAGIRSAHVLTGVDGAKQLYAAPKDCRPDYILTDLRQLAEPYEAPRLSREGTTAKAGRAAVSVRNNRVVITRAGERPIDLLRAATAAIWNCGVSIYALEVPDELFDLAVAR